MTTTNVGSGQTSSGVTVSSGSTEQVAFGGTATDTQVRAGGILRVNHGQALFSIVQNGGQAFVANSGVLSNTTVAVGGFELVSTGGYADQSIVQGVEQVVGGGIATLCSVGHGGEQLVDAGGITNYTLVSAGSIEQAIGGAASNTLVSSGGELLVNGGSAVAANILSGGVLYMLAGSATQTYVGSSGASLIGPGRSTDAYVLSAGVEFVAPDGTASNTTVEPGGVQVVGPLGVARDTMVSAGGVLVAFNQNGAANPGTVISATLMSGSELILSGVTPSHGFDFAAIDHVSVMAGGLIDLAGDPWHDGASATLDASTDILNITGIAQNGALQLAGDYTEDRFVLFSDGYGGTEVAVVAAPQQPASASSPGSLSQSAGKPGDNSVIGNGGTQYAIGAGTTLDGLGWDAGSLGPTLAQAGFQAAIGGAVLPRSAFLQSGGFLGVAEHSAAWATMSVGFAGPDSGPGLSASTLPTVSPLGEPPLTTETPIINAAVAYASSCALFDDRLATP